MTDEAKACPQRQLTPAEKTDQNPSGFFSAADVICSLWAKKGRRNEKIISIDNMLYVYGGRKHFCRAIAKAYIGIRT